MALEDEHPRSFVTVPAEQRPIRHRTASRVLVIADDKVLLEEDSDPGKPGVVWWVTPGGGVGPGETYEQAAVRELQEETGLVITEKDLEGPIGDRTVRHGYSDQVLIQHEQFYIVRTEPFRTSSSGYTEEEKITLQATRWFTREELATVTVWPKQLVQLWKYRPGIYFGMGVVEESTVPLTDAQRSQ
ncbi:NUDIX hydrolase [Propionibacterium freudenreichii]|uniref:NUDIX hydrolase n=1 Tax=Propionibacterium freudenreichii TaxID=1744 RepID=UPI000BC2CBE5|nr:NUDIX domain-containing protein [Propionibacterium freudenreichii]SBN42854.1 NUDIX hydrolase [Propionibacterium freudenreichii]